MPYRVEVSVIQIEDNVRQELLNISHNDPIMDLAYAIDTDWSLLIHVNCESKELILRVTQNGWRPIYWS